MTQSEKQIIRALTALERVSDSHACELSVTGARVFGRVISDMRRRGEPGMDQGTGSAGGRAERRPPIPAGFNVLLQGIERAASDCGLGPGETTGWEVNVRVIVGRNRGRFVEVTCDKDEMPLWGRVEYRRVGAHLGRLGRRAKADWFGRVDVRTVVYRYRYEWWSGGRTP